MKKGDTITYSKEIPYVDYKGKSRPFKVGRKFIITSIFEDTVIASRYGKTVVLEKKYVKVLTQTTTI